MKTPNQNRRHFLKSSSAALLGAGLIGGSGDDIPKIREYRTLGRTGFKVSDIGFGQPQNSALIKAAINSGVNYLDTAEVYGPSQAEIGKIIGEFDRKKIFITTKIYSSRENLLESKENVLESTRKSMETMKIEYLDCLVLQAVDSCKMVKNSAFHEACDHLVAEGRLKYRGISCHGTYFPGDPEDTMQNILMCAIEDGRFDLLLVVYNFLHSEEGGAILRAAKEKNIATTVMKSNPVKMYFSMKDYFEKFEKEGKEMPERWKKPYREFEEHTQKAFTYIEEQGIISNDKQLRDVATRFVLDNPQVDCTLVNFATFDDLEIHLNLSGKRLSNSDQASLDAYRHALGPLYCRHGCNICESSCPTGLPVNTIMRYNYYFQVKGREKEAMKMYRDLPGARPDVCLHCEGFCEKACPYGVATRPLLALAHSNLNFNREFRV